MHFAHCDGFLATLKHGITSLANDAGHGTLWDLVRAKEHITGDILGVRHRRRQQAIDPSAKPHVFERTAN